MKNLKQIVLKKPDQEEKRKEGIYLLICFSLFFLIYFLFERIANFAWVGYLAAAVIAYLLYRVTLKGHVRYRYQISDGKFWVFCRKGRKEELLCSLLLTQAKELRPSADEGADVIAAAEQNVSKNFLLLWEEDGKERRLLFTPNAHILKVLWAYCGDSGK